MKNRFLFVPIFALFSAIAVNGQSYSDSSLSQAWVLGSKLSLAGALHAQGGDAALVSRQLAAANAAAATLGIKLPPLPARKGNRVEDTAAVLGYLLNATGQPIGGILAKSYDAEHAAIFEVGLKANFLLMMYGPGESSTNAIANVIRSRSANMKYLSSMTAQLVKLIEQQADYDAVKAELFDINDLAPKFIAVIHYARNGEAKYAAKDFLGSAAEYSKALAIDPSGSEYFYGRGRANMQLGKNTEAIADYTKAIQNEGNGPNAAKNMSVAYHNRGLLFGMTGKFQLAINDLTHAIELMPNYASAYKVRGLVYRKLGNVKQATADLQTAEELQPGITR